MDNKQNPLLPKQPEATAETPEEMGQMAVEKTVIISNEQTSSSIKKETSNPIVKTLIIIGVIAVIVGLIAAFTVNLYLGIFLMIIGSGCVIACVYLPIGADKK